MEKNNDKRKYTSDEFLAMTDLEGRYELVSGDIYAMSPSPSFIHQKLISRLNIKIGRYIEENHGACEVIVSPSDVKLNDEDTVQPDLFVVCDPNKFDEHGCVGAPDWVIEILSPSNIDHDMVTKLELYMKAGVREYWIVDPMNKRVLVYPFEEAKITGIFTFDDEITAGIFRNNEVPLAIRINDII
mgnify:CR=1 FL=1